MKQESFIVNSATSLMAFANFAKQLFAEHKHLTFTWRIGEKRSLDQNALLHVWLSEYAAHLLGKDRRAVSRGELDGMKRTAKREYFRQTGAPWMVHTVVNPRNPAERKRDFTSSKDWKRGEMYDFLTWLQMVAAGDGLILEARGEYAELQRKEAA